MELGKLDQWIDLEAVPRHFSGRGMAPKPKWMRWRTNDRIIRRCDANETICNQYLSEFLARLEKCG
jgi:hypothetical protein